MRSLFPETDPYRTFRFRVSDLHELHVEEAGNPSGEPVVFLHGGPGAGVSPLHRRFFDPAFWRVILFDQRGSGKATPIGELAQNTTWDLVSDVERIREHLGIDRWLVFGGSWGATLALAYAESHPERVRGLILRGIFLGRKSELTWTMGEGLERIYPDGWAEFTGTLTPRERGDVLQSYHRRLISPEREVRKEAAVAWNRWEEMASHLVPRLAAPEPEEIEREIALARIEAHYFVNGCFLVPGSQLLRDAGKLRPIPGHIVQGRYDMVCPLTSAWELSQAWPEASFEIVADAGHAADEPGIADALVRATEAFKTKRR